jgi:cbb3-type cytochrome oxidase subunit 3
MWHTTISGHHGTHHTVAAAVWIVAGIIAVIAFGDALALLAFALAIVSAAWWIYREVEHRVERNDAEMAPVTHLRRALTGQRDLKKTSAHASWRGPRAA